jgi:hypothetical protein
MRVRIQLAVLEMVAGPASWAFSLAEYAFACGEFGSYGHKSFTLRSRVVRGATRFGYFSMTFERDGLSLCCINTEAWIVSCVSGSFELVGKVLSSLLESRNMPVLELIDVELHRNS